MASTIPIAFSAIRKHYPRRLPKTDEFGGKLAVPALRKFMDGIPGTPCCVQVSHAFNMNGHRVPLRYPGMRRPSSPIEIDGRTYFYLLAVDELEVWLTERYGPGEVLRAPGKADASPREIKRAIRNRPGLLTLRGKKDRWHAEFWDGAGYLQTDIYDGILENPRISFWDVTTAPPAWLVNYMSGR